METLAERWTRIAFETFEWHPDNWKYEHIRLFGTTFAQYGLKEPTLQMYVTCAIMSMAQEILDKHTENGESLEYTLQCVATNKRGIF